MRMEDGGQKRQALDIALQESISFDHRRVSIINCNATSSMFVFWFHVSCYFPVLTACLGPIGNTISIAGVIDKWRFVRLPKDGNAAGTMSVSDPPVIFAFNVISLVLGFVSNFALLLHFGEKLSYLKAQWICIVGWTTASFVLLTDVIMCASKYLDEGQEKSIGFWYAAITTGLYFGCTLSLSTHFVGYLLGMYPARFNLIKNERSLMVFTVVFSILLIWGGAMFSQLMNVSFGNGLYFCVVSILTIGLGDILPTSVASRVLILIYSMLGVINLALIVATTTGIFRSSSGAVSFFHKVEIQRERKLNLIRNNGFSYTPEDTFTEMQTIRKAAMSRQRLEALLSTLLAFIIFWHLGSLGLKFAEGWSYFGGMYFCFLCLLTIGYGDYAPASGAGRALFVVWALGAVPMMSAILSNVGDILLEFSDKIDMSIAKRFKMGFYSILIRGSESWNKFILNDNEIVPEDDLDAENDNTINCNEEKCTEGHESSEYYLKAASLSSPSESGSAPQNLQSRFADEGADLSVHHTGRFSNYMDEDSFRNKFMFLSIKPQSNDLRNMQRALRALKKFGSIARQDKKYSLTFNQWHELNELDIFPFNADTFNDPTFWISDSSPLRFPLNQPRFVSIQLHSGIEEMLADFLGRKEVCCNLFDFGRRIIPDADRHMQDNAMKAKPQRKRSVTF